MGPVADARGGIVEFAGLLFRRSKQLPQRLVGQRRPHQYDGRQVGDMDDRREGFLGVVCQFRLQGVSGGIGADLGEQEHVTVGIFFRDLRCGQCAAGTGPVLDHERLAVGELLKAVREVAGQSVGSPTGTDGHDQFYGAVRPFFGLLGKAGRCGEQERDRDQKLERASNHRHCGNPVSIPLVRCQPRRFQQESTRYCCRNAMTGASRPSLHCEQSVVLLDEDARALNALRGMDARPFERRDDAVGLGLVFQVLHMVLALDELRGLGGGQTARHHAVVDAVRLGVLARVDPRRAGEARCRGDGKNERSEKYGLHGKSPSA
ncbi:hypothetical protein ES703_96341 [subsurface metagenome]